MRPPVAVVPCAGWVGLLIAALLSACAAPSSVPIISTPAVKVRPAAPPGCPEAADELPVQALYGTWEARFDGVPGVARVTFAPHPDYAGSVRGTIVREGTNDAGSQLAGDIADDGLLTLDESRDGRSISAVWSGDMQAASCGREFKGTWRNAIDDRTRNFVLHKTGNLK
ncbi:hypothetical protein BH10PSE18_BH10PSE18_28360 [soil metagenome]